jgi:hypothetical protein
MSRKQYFVVLTLVIASAFMGAIIMNIISATVTAQSRRTPQTDSGRTPTTFPVDNTQDQIQQVQQVQQVQRSAIIYEYRVVSGNTERNLETEINRFARVGFEVVHFATVKPDANYSGSIYTTILRRTR